MRRTFGTLLSVATLVLAAAATPAMAWGGDAVAAGASSLEPGDRSQTLTGDVSALWPLAAGDENLACPPGIPDAGFTDVDPASTHKDSIDCIAWWEITAGKTATTYDPAGPVLRSHMALFLMRMFNGLGHLGEVPGNPQGFVDIGGVSAEGQKAINQFKELSITSGTSPTTYSPSGTVIRAHMAMFLTRLLRADGVTLPDGSDQGFVDIGGVSAEGQKAINQLKQLGITSGTSPTTYDPSGTVTREQMASFIARTLNIGVTLVNVTWNDVFSCNNAEPEACIWSATFIANTAFTLRPYWYANLLPAPPGFSTSGTRVELTSDAQPVTLTEKAVALNSIVYKYFEITFPTGLTTGNHVFEWRWYENDLLVQTTTANILFVE